MENSSKELKEAKDAAQTSQQRYTEDSINKETPLNDIKGRLRNYSYKEATTALTPNKSRMSAPPPSISEEVSDKASSTSGADLGSIEDLISAVMIRKEDWQGKGTTHKLDSICDSINKLYEIYHSVNKRIKPIEYAVFDEEDGMLPQITQIVNHVKEDDTKFTDIIAENVKLRDEMEIVKGLLQKQSKQISALQGKLADQIARSMENNVVIAGITSDSSRPSEDEVKMQVSSFLAEQLEIEENDEEEIEGITKAYRVGQYIKDKHRPIITTVTPALQKKIFDNTGKLKEKVNDKGNPFSVNIQLPDMLAEQKREIRQIIKDRKQQERGLDQSRKSTFLVKSNKVYINGQLQRKVLTAPTPADLFPDETEQKKINGIQLFHSDSVSVKQCSFRAAACVATKINDVHLAYKKVFQANPAADHIVAAFVSEGTSGYQDNSEYGARFRVLKTIQDFNLGDVAVFVIRDYGGQHLGPSRFATMKQVAEEALMKIN